MSRTILDLDLKMILSKVESRYGISLPRGVLTVDYGERGDLYIRFKHVEKPVGNPQTTVWRSSSTRRKTIGRWRSRSWTSII